MPLVLFKAASVRVPAILLAILSLVAVPVVVSGYQDAARAAAAAQRRDYAVAAQSYRRAAWKLPWKPQLLEDAAAATAHFDPLTAVTSFEIALARHDLSPSGWDVYGTSLWAAGKRDTALAAWQAGLQHYPSEQRYYQRLYLGYRAIGDYADEAAWLERWLTSPQAGGLDHYEMGLLLMPRDAARARREFAAASSMDADVTPAVTSLQAALDLADREPDLASRLVIIGRSLALVGEWPLAQSAFEQAVAADARNAHAAAWLGEAHAENGTDGKPWLDRALALAPQDTLVHALRGLYWKRFGQSAAEVEEYARAAQLEPDNPEWQAALGGAFASSGDLISALASYQKAAALAPGNSKYWRLLAAFCADNGVQVSEVGLPAARKAASLSPNDPEVLDALGWVYAQSGLLYNARSTLKQAAGLAPDSPSIHLHLAETYLRGGDQASALNELQRVRQLDPNGPWGALAANLVAQYAP